jgi:hypothetical protein
MSCSPDSRPLRERLMALDDDTELPTTYYWMTLAMVALVITVPLVYRYIWLLAWDIVSGVRQDVTTARPPPGCRRISSAQPAHPIITCIPPILGSRASQYDSIFSFAQLTSKLPDKNGRTEHTWTCITQRESASLALVDAELWLPDPNAADYDDDGEWTKEGGCLVVRFPFTPDFEFNREGSRLLISRLILHLRRKAGGLATEFRIPLVPSGPRTEEKEYGVSPLLIGGQVVQAWNMDREVDPTTLSKLAYTLGISNPMTLFRICHGHERDD